MNCRGAPKQLALPDFKGSVRDCLAWCTALMDTIASLSSRDGTVLVKPSGSTTACWDLPPGSRIMANKPRVSIVIPAYNEAPCLEKLHQELTAVCDMLSFPFEFLFVNDGSTDETEDVLAELHRGDDRVTYLTLSRNFGHQAALAAGLTYASGEAVITMDADLQHPPQMIPRLLELWAEGYEIVNTARGDTADSPLRKKLFSRAFYWIFTALTGVPLEPGSADFRLMSRASVDALNRLPERHRFIRGLVPWLGFRQTCVPFCAPRGGPAVPNTHSAAAWD